MTLEQRQRWAEWFEGQGIRFAFYSARLAKEAQETIHEEDGESYVSGQRAEKLAEEVDDLSIDEASDTSEDSMDLNPGKVEEAKEQEPSETDPRTRILTVFELQSLFVRESPPPKGSFPKSDPTHF